MNGLGLSKKILNVLVIGAHPDDCEYDAAGTAIKYVESGHRVKFVSVSNGDAGHMSKRGKELADIRKKEIERADSMMGIEFEIFDIPDGEIMPTLENRKKIIRLIREWNADIVISHRSNDYHPDHRYTATLVQDSAFQVMVPNICPDTPALRETPVFLYLEDTFTLPSPFRPDIIVPIDDVFAKKVDMFHEMPSQFYEWLPWIHGTIDSVPEDNLKRREWLEKDFRNKMKNNFIEETKALYGKRAETIKMVEAFQVCEYGGEEGLQLSRSDIRILFPFLPEFA